MAPNFCCLEKALERFRGAGCVVKIPFFGDDAVGRVAWRHWGSGDDYGVKGPLRGHSS